jgi:FRG domain.
MNKNKPYRVESVRSWDEYSDKVGALCHGWGFRGHADSTWPLMSTLGRYLNAYVKEKYWTVQEERIARIFQRKAHLFLTHIPERSDTFQWLALMQHHGAPTRLLDFTWSPYVAAFFALVQTTKQAAVWAVNPKRLVNVTERFNEFLGNSRVGPIGIGEPFVMNMRLIAQSGTFIVTKQVGTPIEDIVVAYKDPKDTLVKFELSAEWSGPWYAGTLYDEHNECDALPRSRRARAIACVRTGVSLGTRPSKGSIAPQQTVGCRSR